MGKCACLFLWVEKGVCSWDMDNLFVSIMNRYGISLFQFVEYLDHDSRSFSTVLGNQVV